jgi:hypothetical protein
MSLHAPRLHPLATDFFDFDIHDFDSRIFHVDHDTDNPQITKSMRPCIEVTSFHVDSNRQVYSTSKVFGYDAITGSGPPICIRDNGSYPERPGCRWDKTLMELKMTEHDIVLTAMGNNMTLVSKRGVRALSATESPGTLPTLTVPGFDGMQLYPNAIQVGDQTVVTKEYRVMISIRNFPMQEPHVKWILADPNLGEIFNSISQSPFFREDCAKAVQGARIPPLSTEFAKFVMYTQVCAEHLTAYLEVLTLGDTEYAEAIVDGMQTANPQCGTIRTRAREDTDIAYLTGTCFSQAATRQQDNKIISVQSCLLVCMYRVGDEDQTLELGCVILPEGSPALGHPYRNLLITEMPSSESGVICAGLHPRDVCLEDLETYVRAEGKPDEAWGSVTLHFDSSGVVIGLANSSSCVGVLVAGVPVLLRYPENTSVKVARHLWNHVIIQYPLDRNGLPVAPAGTYFMLLKHYPRPTHTIDRDDYNGQQVGEEIPLAPPTDKDGGVEIFFDPTELPDPQAQMYVWPADIDATPQSCEMDICKSPEPSRLNPLPISSPIAIALDYLRTLLRGLQDPVDDAERVEVEMVAQVVMQVQETCQDEATFLNDVKERLGDKVSAYKHIERACKHIIPGTPSKLQAVWDRVARQRTRAFQMTPDSSLQYPEGLNGEAQNQTYEARMEGYVRRGEAGSSASSIASMLKKHVPARSIWYPRVNPQRRLDLYERTRLFNANQDELFRFMGITPLEHTTEVWDVLQHTDISGVTFAGIITDQTPVEEGTRLVAEFITRHEGGPHQMSPAKYGMNLSTGVYEWKLQPQSAKFRDQLLKQGKVKATAADRAAVRSFIPRPRRKRGMAGGGLPCIDIVHAFQPVADGIRKPDQGTAKPVQRAKYHVLKAIGLVEKMMDSFDRLTPAKKQKRLAIPVPEECELCYGDSHFLETPIRMPPLPGA